MELEDIRQLIATHLTDNWDTSLGPIVLPNQPSEDLAGKLHYDIQIVFPPTGRNRLSIGGFKDIRQTGYLYLLGYIPRDKGTTKLLAGVTHFKNLFEELILFKNTHSLRFKEVNTNTLGLKSQMYRINGSVEFYTDCVS